MLSWMPSSAIQHSQPPPPCAGAMSRGWSASEKRTFSSAAVSSYVNIPADSGVASAEAWASEAWASAKTRASAKACLATSAAARTRASASAKAAATSESSIAASMMGPASKYEPADAAVHAPARSAPVPRTQKNRNSLTVWYSTCLSLRSRSLSTTSSPSAQSPKCLAGYSAAEMAPSRASLAIQHSQPPSPAEIARGCSAIVCLNVASSAAPSA
mmetsp:Transcript_11265/g.37612  ORF Transcript_11265/g.37612 Transcript_11265/m.37612 type:complete len:215 (+) Transcript_11265:650-1294(+)